jgi:hypothetical protein
LNPQHSSVCDALALMSYGRHPIELRPSPTELRSSDTAVRPPMYEDSTKTEVVFKNWIKIQGSWFLYFFAGTKPMWTRYSLRSAV